MEDLGESELGTQEYWDKRYGMEIKNFHTHGDPGEIWFGDDIVDRIMNWMSKTPTIKTTSKIVDVGCGNGMFLIGLAVENYTNLFGVDYSQGAIQLAQDIAKKEQVDIHYSTCNVLEGIAGAPFDVIHDKGTYDAISLSPNARDNMNSYLKNIHLALNSDGFFVITSCNWTKDELDKQFEQLFECFETIPTPQFKFGGKVGSVVTSVVYKKKTNNSSG